MLDHSSVHDGGQLAYLLQPEDSYALFSGSSGYWPGILADPRPAVAFLALGERPNVSGEPPVWMSWTSQYRCSREAW
jgi:hypothetical protein